MKVSCGQRHATTFEDQRTKSEKCRVFFKQIIASEAIGERIRVEAVNTGVQKNRLFVWNRKLIKIE